MTLLRPFALVIAVASAACATGIRVSHVTSTITTQRGNPWNLAMTQFNVSITRHIVACGAEIKGKVEVLPTPVVAVDDAHRYVLESSGRWGTSDITSKLAANGVSTGLNAESTDMTGTVISNIIGTAATVAVGVLGAAAPPPPGKAPLPPPVRVERCKPEIAKAVRELYPPEGSGGTRLRTRVDNATAALELATAEVALLTAQVKADSSLKPRLVTALADQAKRKTELSDLQNNLDADLKLTTDVQLVTWPLQSTVYRTVNPYDIAPSVVEKWLEPEQQGKPDLTQFAVHFALYRHDSASGQWLPAETVMSGAGAVDVSVGVPVRLSQMGRLLTCVRLACPTEPLTAIPSASSMQTANDLPILQLGQIYVVPVTGGLFKSESAEIALNDSGLPTSIRVAEKASAAAGASATAKDAASQIAALPGQISAARLARTQAEVNQLNANAALATAQANATVQGQTATLAAQSALITAQTNLATAQANAGLPLQTSALNAATALLNAQGALATAQASSKDIDQTSVWAAQASLANAQAAQINAAATLAKAQAGTQ